MCIVSLVEQEISSPSDVINIKIKKCSLSSSTKNNGNTNSNNNHDNNDRESDTNPISRDTLYAVSHDNEIRLNNDFFVLQTSKIGR